MRQIRTILTHIGTSVWHSIYIYGSTSLLFNESSFGDVGTCCGTVPSFIVFCCKFAYLTKVGRMAMQQQPFSAILSQYSAIHEILSRSSKTKVGSDVFVFFSLFFICTFFCKLCVKCLMFNTQLTLNLSCSFALDLP